MKEEKSCNIKYRVIGRDNLHKKEYTCRVPANFLDFEPDRDIVAFGRWINTKKPYLAFRVNKRRGTNNIFFLSEKQLKEIIIWFKEEKRN